MIEIKDEETFTGDQSEGHVTTSNSSSSEDEPVVLPSDTYRDLEVPQGTHARKHTMLGTIHLVNEGMCSRKLTEVHERVDGSFDQSTCKQCFNNVTLKMFVSHLEASASFLQCKET